MRITDFIKASILLFSSVATANDVLKVPGSDWKVISKCSTNSKEKKCQTYLLREEKKIKIADFPQPPVSVSKFGNSIEIVYGCGTSCSASYFYNESGRVVGPLPLIDIVDGARGVALSLSSNPLKLYSIKENKIVASILLDDASANVVDSIIETSLDKNKISIKYRKKNGAESEVIYDIPENYIN